MVPVFRKFDQTYGDEAGFYSINIDEQDVSFESSLFARTITDDSLQRLFAYRLSLTFINSPFAFQEITREVGIESVPTYMSFRNGRELGVSGGASPPSLARLIHEVSVLQCFSIAAQEVIVGVCTDHP